MRPARLMPLVAIVTSVDKSGPPDEFGDPTEVTATTTYRAWLEQQQRNEDTAGTDQQAERWAVYLDPSAADAVSGSDRVTVGDAVLELDGPPWTVVNPRTGAVSHVQATARRVV